MSRTDMRWMTAVVAVFSVTGLLVGCSGHGGGAWTRILTGVVVENDFVVAAGERVGARGDVVVQCQTATVNGELISMPSAGAGANGGSITIEAQNAVVVTGQIAAGDGTAGAATGNGGNGGAGGGVTLSSAHGDITLGTVAGAAQVRTRQAGGGASLRSGSGGNGGNGLLGGAGGVGGNITVACPDGIWRVTPAPNLLVFGNGGHGGNGNVAGAQLNGLAIPETMPNAGGDSGFFRSDIGTVEGVTVIAATSPEGQAVRMLELPEGTVAGWEGGDAGSSVVGGETDTAQRRAAAAALPQGVGPAAPRLTRLRCAAGANGGLGGGDGGSATCTAWQAGNPDGQGVEAFGGQGGDAHARFQTLGESVVVMFRKMYRVGGNGGDARAFGGRGADGGSSEDGGKGGAAWAWGGAGGVGADWTDEAEYWLCGRGGRAYAESGDGGNGGDGSASSRGGSGGSGGVCSAYGGDGGVPPNRPELAAPGGDADASGGDGGRGGDGNPRGSGGDGGNTGAVGGDGTPQGTETWFAGYNGLPGKLITEPPPDQQRKYGVVESQCTSYAMLIKAAWYIWTGQVYGAAAGTTPLALSQYMSPGETSYLNAARNKLWLATHVHIRRIDNPLAGPTEAARFQTGITGFVWASALWVDETRDLLYGAASIQPKVFVWQNASTVTGDREPDRTIDLVGVVPVSLTGDSTADRLFVRTNPPGNQGRILILDNASTRTGLSAPDREMTGLTTCTYGTGLAYAREQDMLYVDLQQAVGRISSAGTRNGAAAPTLIQGPATGITDEAVSLDVFGDSDVLLVADFYQALMLFENASTISGNASYQKRDANVTRINGVAAFVEP